LLSLTILVLNFVLFSVEIFAERPLKQWGVMVVQSLNEMNLFG